jgi:Tol biopolymer transport system component
MEGLAMRTIYIKKRAVLLMLVVLFIGCDFISPFSAKQHDNYPACIERMKLPKQLTATEHDFIAYWSPDGEHVAFLTVRNTFDPYVAAVFFELWLMQEDGHDQHPLIKYDQAESKSIAVGSVSWFPDSRHLLIKLSDSNSSEIWKINLNGDKIRLTNPEDFAQSPSVAPDGSKIAYLIQGTNPPQGSPVYRLYVANDDGSNPILIETGLIEKYCWTADAQGFIYTLYDFEKANFDLWKASISGADKKKFSNTLEDETDPACSSDGKYLAFCVNNALYLTLSHDFQPQKLLANAREPRWVPGNNLILFYAEQTTDSTRFWTESRITDLEGNILKRISEGDFTAVNFSPEGRYIIYSLAGNLWIDRLF